MNQTADRVAAGLRLAQIRAVAGLLLWLLRPSGRRTRHSVLLLRSIPRGVLAVLEAWLLEGVLFHQARPGMRPE